MNCISCALHCLNLSMKDMLPLLFLPFLTCPPPGRSICPYKCDHTNRVRRCTGVKEVAKQVLQYNCRWSSNIGISWDDPITRTNTSQEKGGNMSQSREKLFIREVSANIRTRSEKLIHRGTYINSGQIKKYITISQRPELPSAHIARNERLLDTRRVEYRPLRFEIFFCFFIFNTAFVSPATLIP